MTGNHFRVLPKREARGSNTSSPHRLKSCLRKGGHSKKESDPSLQSSMASKAPRTTNTPLSSQLHCEPAEDDNNNYSAVRTNADDVLAQPAQFRNDLKQYEYDSELSEHQFMKISHQLVTEYNRGYCTHPIDVKQLLHYYLPTYQQRRKYYSSLSQNVSVLPMFPEPGEHISYNITRCIQRVFGPILMSEMNVVDHNVNMLHPAALDKSNQPATFRPNEYVRPVMDRHRIVETCSIIDQSPPLDLDDNAMFPAPTMIKKINHNLQTQQFFPESSATPRARVEHDRPRNLTVQTSPTNNAPSDDRFNAPPAPPSLLSVARQSKLRLPTPTAMSSHQQRADAQAGNSPPPQPLPFFNKSPKQLETTDLKSPSHELFAQSPSRNESPLTRMKDANDVNKKSIAFDENEVTNGSHDPLVKVTTPKSPSTMTSQYQRLNNKEMLPPIIPRQDVLFYPLPPHPPSSPCCGFDNTYQAQRRQRRPPSYLQLYVKCEWSEPFVQPDASMDIITWYKNKDNDITADRTLVVCGTTSLYEVIQSILLSFGLLDTEVVAGPEGDSAANLHKSLGYNGVCFLSDIKATTCSATSSTKLTPLPIPGFYYKYVPRGLHEGYGANVMNSQSERNGSTVLSNDPTGLTRTLTAQVLDTPLFPQSNKDKNTQSQGRTRLAFVYCTPKRQAYVSSRTQRAVLPETIYHFQIILEGIVCEDELPSSFQTQIPVRCVNGFGGVQGGNIVDTPYEVDELNRKLWGKRNVIGLVSPSSKRIENTDKIIDILSTPLFDPIGNQSSKEGVVQRCLYQIFSGRLSMKIAESTQGTVEACIGTTDLLARHVDSVTNSVYKKLDSCTEEDLDDICFGAEYDRKLEALVSKVGL